MTTAAPDDADMAAMEQKFTSFRSAAHQASRAGQALLGPLDEARALLAASVKPDSQAAKLVAKRFAEVCARHNLGDPVAYARWVVEFGLFPSDIGAGADAWRFLADATAAARPA